MVCKTLKGSSDTLRKGTLSLHLEIPEDSDSLSDRDNVRMTKRQSCSTTWRMTGLSSPVRTHTDPLGAFRVNDKCRCFNHDYDNCQGLARLTALGRTFVLNTKIGEKLVRETHTVKEGSLRFPECMLALWGTQSPTAGGCSSVLHSNLLLLLIPDH